MGDMLLQKTFSPDHMSKRSVKNRGELPRYYVENSHEPIIDKETFQRVQQEIARRAKAIGMMEKPSTVYPFTSLVRCGICGKYYRRKIANASSKYAKAAWICPTFNDRGKEICPSRQISEKILTSLTAEVLGVAEFDRDMLLERLTEITVSAPDQLIYVFKDGHTQDVFWHNPSRRNSWTEEMRQAAREKSIESAKRRRKDGNA